MNRIAVCCMITALLIGSLNFPQYDIGHSAVWNWFYSIPLIALMGFTQLTSKSWQPVLLGLVGGLLVASVMTEQWLAPFPQLHWLSSLGIDTPQIAVHLCAAIFLLGVTRLPTGPLKNGLTVLGFLGILLYWVLPQQFLYENLKALSQDARSTLIYQNGDLVPIHWRREVFMDPPWKEFPSVAYNEYSLASIGHGMGLQMDPDNEGRRNLLYTIQLYGSMLVIYLRVLTVLAGLIMTLGAFFERIQKKTDLIFRISVTSCYILPPVCNLLLTLAAMEFAESEGEIGRYIWINLSLSLAGIAVLLQQDQQKEIS